MTDTLRTRPEKRIPPSVSEFTANAGRQLQQLRDLLESCCVEVVLHPHSKEKTKVATLDQILEDMEAFGAWAKCSVCLRVECRNEGDCR